MPSPVKLYQREMHKRLGFFATWLPGDPIEIGDVGLLEAGRFRRMTSLDELCIPYEVGVGPTRQDVQVSSSQGINLITSVGATAAASLKTDVRVEFSRKGAFIFNASTLRPRLLVNRSAVSKAIMDTYKIGQWDRGWLLVDSLHVADRATILVSEDNAAQVVLSANGAGVQSGISLADPKIDFTITSVRGSIVHVVGGRDLHPIYSCLQLRTGFLGEASIVPVRGISGSHLGREFSRLALDDLLQS
jgi:hypothetical protein